VPRPHRPYQANGLHDPAVVCLLDVQLGPRETETGWPAADLTIIEQESGACPLGRVTHHHDPEAIAAHTANELTAEHAALMDRARQHHDAHFLRLAELAQRAAAWADKVRAAAHAGTVQAQADRARARIAH